MQRFSIAEDHQQDCPRGELQCPKLQPSIKDVAFFDPEVLRAVEVALPEFQDQRLRAMDQAGISIAILSQTAPVVQSIRDSALATELAHEANDVLHQRIETAPKRFRGFACLALQDVDSACDELKRCIQELGFVGALVNGSTNGAYLDGPQAFRGHPELEGPVWSWTCDTATHVLRLVFGGVFDRHHNARLILGHMGETLPYMLWRLDSRAAVTTVGRGLSRPPAETLRNHMMVTTSGVCADAPLRCALATMGD